ncbi:MAG: glycyl-radical enzyme activating protein [Eubacterium sp.]
MKLRITNIQRYSLNDGDGIRTTVFLKGCPMRCRWCCNPETQLAEPQIMYRKNLCIGCGECGFCRQVCPVSAISFSTDGRCIPNFRQCSGCLSCAAVCPSGAMKEVGREVEISELLDIAERDAVFYRRGAGGITLSGGEPLAQNASIELLKQAQERYLRTAVETCGYVDRNNILQAGKYLDQVYFDIKSMDESKHEVYTGKSPLLIHENLKALRAEYPDLRITVRTPVIPGFNDDEQSLKAIENFLHSIGIRKWEKLPYHTYGKGKYEMLGRPYEMETKADGQEEKQST